MPNHRASDRWEHPIYRFAYVREFRGNACTVIHGSYPLTTGYKWAPASRRLAMQVLEQRLLQHIGHTTPDVPQQRTCADLWEQFVLIRFPKLKPTLKTEYTRYFSFVPAKSPVTDIEGIRKKLIARVKDTKYSQNTLNRVFTRIRTVFRFGIEQGWLTVNPVHEDMIPAMQYHDPNPYTDEQIQTALRSLTGQDHAFVTFLAATACRPVEATRLVWSDVYEDHCIVWSAKGGSRAQRRRVIPFALCPEAKAAIDMARGKEWSSDTLVFGTPKYTKISRAFIDALPEGEGRGLYDIRKCAINRWKRAGWPEEVRHAIAGHEKDVAERHYESPYSASELARFVQDSMLKTTPMKTVKAA